MDSSFYKRKRKDRVYDKLHRGFVNACIGVTLFTSCMLGYKIYEYFRYIRPLQSAQAKLVQEQLLLEGQHVDDPSEVKL